tara:strand:+ start:4801 stop:5454 length:654 start_codon:yes stop_codon:yes gene_type:complete
MEDETKKVDVEIKKVDNPADTTPVDEKKPADSNEAPAVDWKKRYEDTATELNQAKFTLTKKNIEEKKKKTVDPDEDGDDGDDEPKDNIQDIVKMEVEKAQLSMRGDIITEEMDRLSQDVDEQKVIQLFYENKIVKTGFDRTSIRKDLELAQILANGPRLGKVLSEVQKKKQSDDATNTNGGSGGHKIESDSSKGPYLSDSDKALMAKYGIKPEEINK